MKAAQAQYRPSIFNKPLPKRRVAKPATRLHVARAPRTPRRPGRRPAALAVMRPNGMSVFALLTLAGAFLTLVFVVALRYQRNTLQLNHQDVELRSALDQTQHERRQLLVEQSRANSPRETELRSRQNGLNPLKLDERTAAYKAAVKAEAKLGKAKSANAAAADRH